MVRHRAVCKRAVGIKGRVQKSCVQKGRVQKDHVQKGRVRKGSWTAETTPRSASFAQ